MSSLVILLLHPDPFQLPLMFFHVVRFKLPCFESKPQGIDDG